MLLEVASLSLNVVDSLLCEFIHFMWHRITGCVEDTLDPDQGTLIWVYTVYSGDPEYFTVL